MSLSCEFLVFSSALWIKSKNLGSTLANDRTCMCANVFALVEVVNCFYWMLVLGVGRLPTFEPIGLRPRPNAYLQRVGRWRREKWSIMQVHRHGQKISHEMAFGVNGTPRPKHQTPNVSQMVMHEFCLTQHEVVRVWLNRIIVIDTPLRLPRMKAQNGRAIDLCLLCHNEHMNLHTVLPLRKEKRFSGLTDKMLDHHRRKPRSTSKQSI